MQLNLLYILSVKTTCVYKDYILMEPNGSIFSVIEYIEPV